MHVHGHLAICMVFTCLNCMENKDKGVDSLSSFGHVMSDCQSLVKLVPLSISQLYLLSQWTKPLMT